MKSFVLLSRDLSETGSPGGIAAQRLAEALVELGHRVHLIAGRAVPPRAHHEVAGRLTVTRLDVRLASPAAALWVAMGRRVFEEVQRGGVDAVVVVNGSGEMQEALAAWGLWYAGGVWDYPAGREVSRPELEALVERWTSGSRPTGPSEALALWRRWEQSPGVLKRERAS